MNHKKSGRKLNRTSAHRKAMFNNMVSSLLEHERIKTTTPKAKELRKIADKLITLGKKGDLQARREAYKYLGNRDAVHRLFHEIAPRNAERNGGYTRILKIGNRYGDCAPMSLIELVERENATI